MSLESFMLVLFVFALHLKSKCPFTIFDLICPHIINKLPFSLIFLRYSYFLYALCNLYFLKKS